MSSSATVARGPFMSWLKLHESPVEHCPVAFRWKLSETFLSTLAFFPFWLLLLGQSTCSGLWSFEFSSTDRYVVWHMSSILTNLCAHCFVLSLGHTKPIQSETEQNPVILTCTILPGWYPRAFHSQIIELDPIERLNLGCRHSANAHWINLRVLVPLQKLWLHRNARRSCNQFVFIVRSGRVFEHAALRHLLVSGSVHTSWEASSMQTPSLHPASCSQGNLFSLQSSGMSHVRQLTLLSRLPWSTAQWFEDSLFSHILQSWSRLSSFEIPQSLENIQDAFPRSYHRENKFHKYDEGVHLHFERVVLEKCWTLRFSSHLSAVS